MALVLDEGVAVAVDAGKGRELVLGWESVPDNARSIGRIGAATTVTVLALVLALVPVDRGGRGLVLVLATVLRGGGRREETLVGGADGGDAFAFASLLASDDSSGDRGGCAFAVL